MQYTVNPFILKFKWIIIDILQINNTISLRWSSIDLPGLQISMIWANAIICMIWAGIQSSLKVIKTIRCSCIKAAPGCQKSSPSYQFSSLNFDFQKLSVRSVEDHLKRTTSLEYLSSHIPKIRCQQETVVQLMGEMPWLFIIDREAREIMHLVASVRPSVHLFALSWLNFHAGPMWS